MYKKTYFKSIVVEFYRLEITQIIKDFNRIICDNHLYINLKLLNNYDIIIAYREIAKKINYN